MPKYLGIMILAIAIMVVAFIGKDHRGTLFSDSVNAVTSLAIGAPPSEAGAISPQVAGDNLPNPADQRQIDSYIQSKFNQGLSQGATGSAQLEKDLASPADAVSTIPDNYTVAASQSLQSLNASGSLPDATDQKAIDSYIAQKFQEGYSHGSAH